MRIERMHLTPELVGRVVERLRALADETRLRLLLRLKAGECNVTALTEDTGVAQASVSKHLTVLRQAGLVQLRRHGAHSIYSVQDESVFELCDLMCDGVRRHVRQQQAAMGPWSEP